MLALTYIHLFREQRAPCTARNAHAQGVSGILYSLQAHDGGVVLWYDACCFHHVLAIRFLDM